MDKLDEILQYYKDTYTILNQLEEIKAELIANNVEVNGDSFFCPIYNDELDAIILLAGTKDKADMWVLKKIIRLIKSKKLIYTMFNGNSDYLISQFSRYNINIISREGDVTFLSFN